MKNKIYTICLVLLCSLGGPVMAQTSNAPDGNLIPPMAAQPPVSGADLNTETHPVLNLMPDKSELVRLDREAASVIIGNPSHISVVIDTPRLAVVIPRTPGATYFTILDKQGNVIMQRHAVVAAPKKNYVRVRRSCANVPSGTDCQPTSVYFCPDMCHEIGADGAEGSSTSSTPLP